MTREHVAEGFTARVIDGKLTRVTCTRCGRSIDIGLHVRMLSPSGVLYLFRWRARHPAEGACS